MKYIIVLSIHYVYSLCIDSKCNKISPTYIFKYTGSLNLLIVLPYVLNKPRCCRLLICIYDNIKSITYNLLFTL